MSVGNLTLTITLSMLLGGVIYVSTSTIFNVLDEKRDIHTVFTIALSYRDHMTSSRCTLPSTALSLNVVRTTLTGAGLSPPAVENESAWRMTFDGGSNRQEAVTVFKVDSASNITRSSTFPLPVPGGDRSHEFFDAVFDSRICP